MAKSQLRKDYENELKSLGYDPLPDPVIITLDGDIHDGYHKILENGPQVRDARIVGARLTNHLDPQGEMHRLVMLLTDGYIGRPPIIDAVINGVRLLLRWNGSRPQVQYTAEDLTAAEVEAIQTYALEES